MPYQQQENGARGFQQSYSRSLEAIAEMLKPFPGVRQAEDKLRQIIAGIRQPFSVAVCGHVKRGKSSLINALIGRELTVVNTNTATATINRITYASGEQLGMFTAYWHDRAPELLTLSRLQRDWTGTTQEVEQRAEAVDFLELYSDAEFLRDVQIIDTPGLGAAADFHERKIQQFLKGRETDAVLYVLDTQGMEHDEQALRTFRESGMKSFSPYNCLGVIHLWDSILWNAIDDGTDFEPAYADIWTKATNLGRRLSQYVAEIIPVSAPLALISKRADETFWAQLHALLQNYASLNALKDDISEPERYFENQLGELWRSAKQLGMPLESFRVMLYYLKAKSSATFQESQTLLLQLSGLPELQKLLERKFFKEKAIISMRQTRAKARLVLDEIYLFIRQQYDEAERQLHLENRVLSELFTPDLKMQMQRLHEVHQNEFKALHENFINIDGVRIRTADDIETTDNAYLLLREWPEKSHLFTVEELQALDTFLAALIEERPIAPPVGPALMRKACLLENMPDAKTRTCAAKLRDLLNQYF